LLLNVRTDAQSLYFPPSPFNAKKMRKLLYDVGRSNFLVSHYQAAITNFSKSIEIDPSSADTWYFRAICEYEIKEYTNAISDYDKAIQLNSEQSWYYIGRGRIEYKLENYSKALLDWDKAIELDPTNSVAYFNRGLLKVHAYQNFADGVADYTKAIQFHNDPNEWDIYLKRGNAKFSLNDFEGAMADYNKTIEINPTNATAFYDRGMIMARIYTNFSAAVADFTEAIKLHNDPQEEDIFVKRGDMKMQLRDFSGAVADYSKAIEMNPADKFAQTNLLTAQQALRELKK
jgi:serine/threonine-protein kinase